MAKKDYYDICNLKCKETNSLLLKYGFVEKIMSLNCKKKDDKRYLYLQLKPAIYNFRHTDTTGRYQGFDFFMYNTHNIEDAIYLNQHAKTMRPFMLHMFGIHGKLNRFESVMDQLIEEDNDDFFEVMSKYEPCFDKKAFYYL